MASKVVIFTDLDGTLLDHQTYSFVEAKPALIKTKETKTPVIMVTSKTRAENETILKEMGLWQSVPFIVENGGAIYIPKGYFSFDLAQELPKEKIAEADKFSKIELGKPYQEVRKIMNEAAIAAGLEIRAIGDMTTEEFQNEVNFKTTEEARRAQKREYQEGYKILNIAEGGMKPAQDRIRQEIEKRGFFMSVGGRFCQIMGSKSKIKAVKILTTLFKKEFGDIHTIGLGDAPSDIEFCEYCDEGYIVKNPLKIVGAETEPPKIHLINEVGPAGWNKVVLNALKQ